MTLTETAVPGEKFSIDDILMEGPIIDGLRSEESWKSRTEYLDRFFTIPQTEYLLGKAERDRILNESLSHDEIVLWFEFDLFCQANLLYYLNWYASRDKGNTRLTLICPETFPGRAKFRGLGELRAEELESLFPQRKEVTPEQSRIAEIAWQSLSSDNPHEIEQFLQTDSSALPLVAPALRAHLERFPSTLNGLGILGQKTLEILNVQAMPFHTLFGRVNETPEMFRHGMGDLSLLAYLDMWASGTSPLIQENGSVEITPAGRSVIENKVDAVELNGIDLWYGGVHLTPGNVWRWNAGSKLIQRP